MLGDDAVEPLLQLEHVADADFHVAGRAFGAAEQLVDHDIRVGQGVALALGAAAQQHRAHAGGLADAVGVHVAGEKLHGVINRQPGGDAAARRVDVEVDVLLRIGHLEEQQLGDDEVGHHVVHGRAQEHDAVHQQAGIDVVAALTPAGLLDHHRD